MRVIQIAAVALLFAGAGAAGFTIWQIVETTTAETELRGPAPILLGDAPPPATSTPVAQALGAAATPGGQPSPSASPVAPTPVARNLAPAATPVSTPDAAATLSATAAPISAAANSASRQQPKQHGAPGYLRIPRIDIVPLIVPVGLNERGEMASPESYEQVGWWQFGAAPGDFGRAVLAGHVDTPSGKAIFYGIDRLAPGDEIFVGTAEADSVELRFVVTGAALYHIEHVPVDQIFGSSTERELILITCGGYFDRDAGQYLYRRVVFAKLAP